LHDAAIRAEQLTDNKEMSGRVTSITWTAGAHEAWRVRREHIARYRHETADTDTRSADWPPQPERPALGHHRRTRLETPDMAPSHGGEHGDTNSLEFWSTIDTIQHANRLGSHSVLPNADGCAHITPSRFPNAAHLMMMGVLGVRMVIVHSS